MGSPEKINTMIIPRYFFSVQLQQKILYKRGKKPLGWKNGCQAFSSSEVCSAMHAWHCVQIGYQNKIS
jgi:hypothetical protein